MLYYQGYEIAEEYSYLEEEELHVLYLSPELYRCVVRQMQKNLERRGKV